MLLKVWISESVPWKDLDMWGLNVAVYLTIDDVSALAVSVCAVKIQRRASQSSQPGTHCSTGFGLQTKSDWMRRKNIRTMWTQWVSMVMPIQTLCHSIFSLPTKTCLWGSGGPEACVPNTVSLHMFSSEWWKVCKKQFHIETWGHEWLVETVWKFFSFYSIETSVTYEQQ